MKSATVSGGNRSVFTPLIEQPEQRQLAEEPSPAQRLLDWLQCWSKDTISMREIHIYGPNVVRGRERATAETLVQTGWLAPAPKHRRDMAKWVIIRKPIVAPQVAT